MKRLFFLVMAFSLTLSACLPAPATNPAPVVENLEATAAILVQQTLQSLPTPTVVPSNTPVVVASTPTDTPTQATATETQNPILLTLTATLGTGTAAPGSESSLSATPGTLLPLTPTPSNTSNPAASITPVETSYPQHSGTMPPNLPYGDIKVLNRSKADVYISLRCVTKDDYVTIIEFPVKGYATTRAPAGQYTYVVWVGGNKLVGSFSLAKSEDLTINIYKDRVGIR
jgi:hypothetical protein